MPSGSALLRIKPYSKVVNDFIIVNTKVFLNSYCLWTLCYLWYFCRTFFLEIFCLKVSFPSVRDVYSYSQILPRFLMCVHITPLTALGNSFRHMYEECWSHALYNSDVFLDINFHAFLPLPKSHSTLMLSLLFQWDIP